MNNENTKWWYILMSYNININTDADEEEIMQKIQETIDWLYRSHPKLNYQSRPKIFIQVDNNNKEDTSQNIKNLIQNYIQMEETLSKQRKNLKKQLHDLFPTVSTITISTQPVNLSCPSDNEIATTIVLHTLEFESIDIQKLHEICDVYNIELAKDHETIVLKLFP